jgi:hypothetical protein
MHRLTLAFQARACHRLMTLSRGFVLSETRKGAVLNCRNYSFSAFYQKEFDLVDMKKYLQDVKRANTWKPISFSATGLVPSFDDEGKLVLPSSTKSSDSIVVKQNHRKVTVVGCGQVGMAIAYALVNQTAARTVALVDMNELRLEGEAQDLQQGSAFHDHVRVVASHDYSGKNIVNLDFSFFCFG